MADSIIIWSMVLCMGACMGSFLTLATYRLPRDEKIGMTRSRCPSCSTPLGFLDLFPILTWVFSGGKCRHCKTKVSIRYPLTELACAIGAVLAVYKYGLTLEAVAIAGLWWSIVAIVITDLEHTIILDEVQIAIILFGLLYHYGLGNDLGQALLVGVEGLVLGLVIKYGFLWIRRKDGLGLGDVKLLFGVGVWLAAPISFVPFLFFSGFMGVLFGSLWRLTGRGEIFPFGPALAFSLLLCVVWPDAAAMFWHGFGGLER